MNLVENNKSKKKKSKIKLSEEILYFELFNNNDQENFVILETNGRDFTFRVLQKVAFP